MRQEKNEIRCYPCGTCRSARGNVIFIVLIGIALFAALSFSLTRGSRQTAGMSTQQATVLANEIVTYANGIRQAVETVMLNGCYDNQINFISSGYPHNNPNAPVDKRCNVFDPVGGGLNWSWPSLRIFIEDNFTPIIGTHRIRLTFSGDVYTPNAGTSCSSAACNELNLVMGYINFDVCRQINLLTQNMRELAEQASGGLDCCGTHFTGTYNYNANFNLTLQGSFTGRRPPLCVKPAGSDMYYLIVPLLER